MEMFLSKFFHIRVLILIKYHKHQGRVGSIMHFFCFEIFFPFITITRPTPTEQCDHNWKLRKQGFY